MGDDAATVEQLRAELRAARAEIERRDHALEAAHEQQAATAQILRYTLTNIGNGSEKFGLLARANAGGDDFDPSSAEIILDTNGNGAYDAGVDTLYVAGTNEPQLAPDASQTVFVRSVIPAGVTDGQRARVDLVATAMTGSGAPGTVFTGQGQGGGNAIVGATGGTAEDDG